MNMHIKHFFDFFRMYRQHELDSSMCFDGGRLHYRKYKPVNKFKFYVSMAVVRDFMTHMRKHGFDATLFPMYELSSYAEIGLKPYDGIPIYLEVKDKTNV